MVITPHTERGGQNYGGICLAMNGNGQSSSTSLGVCENAPSNRASILANIGKQCKNTARQMCGRAGQRGYIHHEQPISAQSTRVIDAWCLLDLAICELGLQCSTHFDAVARRSKATYRETPLMPSVCYSVVILSVYWK